MTKLLFVFLLSVNLSAQTVYKTPSGTKYHLSICRMVKNASSSLPLDKALREGLSPCKICRPPFRETVGIISKSKKTPGENTTNRCPATIKEGLRCKRNTKIGNNFCFQHLPN
ncbi:hypothetical protein FNJ88_11470 [Chryseobacterium sp. SNU WT5]|uniref:hypothetical protein n=1 Tax=Chryseobacterium sp. SNU WT5 TaxID=2594269 RepID=UPI00117DF7D1|nr:hypothetical protein [Chryseobacterium sp. SNU WT5]QDP86136.1 hypothetical protein FNJ88_11470 [Chryseobacterium sp. SNU WT5]